MRFSIALRVFVCLLAVSSPAAAQFVAGPRDPIDVERFKPAITFDSFIITEGSDVRPDSDRWQVGLYHNFAINPLIVVNEFDELSDQFVATRLGVDFFGSITVFEPFAIGVDLPFFLAQTGDENPNFGGLGDIRIVPKFRILDDRDIFGLAAAGELRVPTHSDEEFSGGARNVVFIPKMIADHRFGQTGFRLGGNLGVMIREGTQFYNVQAFSEFVYSAAAEYYILGWDSIAAIGADFHGGVGLPGIETSNDIDFEELPLEGTLYAKIFPAKEWEVNGGPSVGIIPGYGIPTVRAFVGVKYTPTHNDRDGDGIPDDEDQCPDNPEDRDGFEDADGCPETTEERDTDGDGIFDNEDMCPNAKETINGIQDEDGCPDKGEPKVIRKEKQLVILENVEFATGSAVIQPQSYGILNQVALMMKANPDIKLVRVEGHTDSRGDDQMNMWLSQARSDSVRRHLIGQGIDAGRLEAKGYGETRPLVKEEDAQGKPDPAALQKNRRVEFIIVTEEGAVEKPKK